MPRPGGMRNKRGAKQKAAYKEKGKQIAETHHAEMAEQLATLKKGLEGFAMKYKSKIQKDPQFRSQFNQMCREIGVDPLQSKKGFWASALGFGDFYYELGIQCITVCMATRAQNGGLMDVDEMCRHLSRVRGASAQEISGDDVESAVGTLKVLGNGFSVHVVGSRKVIQSVPTELNSDHMTILSLTEGNGGQVTSSHIIETLHWERERTDKALELLLGEGMLWADEQAGAEVAYWCMTFSEGVGDADMAQPVAVAP